MNNDDRKFIRLTPFKMQVIQSFPFIDADFDALTNYELLCKVVDYLNTTVDNVNLLSDDFTTLYNYVHNYFNNLYVQEEINTKLDEMASDGTLTNLIKGYVDPIYEAFEETITTRQNTYETNLTNRQTAFEDTVTGDLQVMDIKVNESLNTNPVPVSSTAGMTDHDTVYLNTTDGKWYYYDGEDFVIGGTYQATGIADNSVTFNNLTPLNQDVLYKVVSPSELIWTQGYSRYNGNITTDNNVTSSQAFRVSKGSTITASDSNLKSRYTFYTFAGGYISNTGTFQYRATYTVPADGYCVISSEYVSGEDTLTPVQVASTYSCDCLVENKNISFSTYSTYTNRYESESIYLPKGSVIKTTDYGKMNSSSEMTDAIGFIGINYYGNDKLSHEYVNFGQDAQYSNNSITTTKDSYVKIYVRFKGGKTLLDTQLPLIKNLIEIKRPYSPENNFLDHLLYRVYISNNGDIELLEYTNGAILFRIKTASNSIVVKQGDETVNEITYTQLLTKFSSNVEEYNGFNYIKIPSYNCLLYNKFLDDFTISNLNATDYGDDNIVLVANAYANIIKSELLPIYFKKQLSANNAFNSASYIPGINWKTKVEALTDKLNTNSTNIEVFTFFTDPHLMGGGDTDFSDKLESYVGTLQKYYNSSPMNFIVGGGDWLNNSDSASEAGLKLGYVDGFMNSMFKNYYGLVGNHDTNYQGETSLDTDDIINLWYRKYGKAYFSFDGVNSKNYCLDSGKEGAYNAMTDYRWEQIAWLANKLVTDDSEHATVFSHIVWNNDEVEPFADNFTKLINAYNSHTTISLNSVSYDFSGCSGHVDYVLSGHIHDDKYDTVNGVLCIATTTFAYNQNTPTFDMIVNDYDNEKAYFIRVGNGSNREFNI